ncbi:MAG: uroporphyrinogen decarboxylase family protein [Anaerolineae bacterium]|jgi:hypothetical protein
MNWRERILARFSGEGDESPLYLPDLSLWYEWHRSQETLPPEWLDCSLPDVARLMGVPVWLPIQPWLLELEGVEVHTIEESGERRIEIETRAGRLQTRWSLGPDGDWWRVEYPVKSKADLPAALELVKARSYSLDDTAVKRTWAMVGQDGVLALELPRRPFSELLHEILGWSDGLALLDEPMVLEMLIALEGRLQSLVHEIAALPGHLVLAPDNLDGQFISPQAFERRLRDSYRLTARMLQRNDKHLVVHVGGPGGHLLAPLAEAGVEGVEGVAGPPQGNSSLAQAREAAGPDLILWGGIAQDYLMEARPREEFEAAVAEAVTQARGDRRIILGVADRVPTQAELDRLQALPELIDRAWQNA